MSDAGRSTPTFSLDISKVEKKKPTTKVSIDSSIALNDVELGLSTVTTGDGDDSMFEVTEVKVAEGCLSGISVTEAEKPVSRTFTDQHGFKKDQITGEGRGETHQLFITSDRKVVPKSGFKIVRQAYLVDGSLMFSIEVSPESVSVSSYTAEAGEGQPQAATFSFSGGTWDEIN